MPKNRWKGWDEEDDGNIKIELSTESVFGGSQSLKITTPITIRESLREIDVVDLQPASLHKNYYKVTDFEEYDDYGDYQNILSYDWTTCSWQSMSIGEAYFEFLKNTGYMSISDSNIFTFQVKSNDVINFDIIMGDGWNNWGATMTTDFTDGNWKRMEIPVDYGNCRLNYMDTIRFFPRGGIPGATIYLDDIHFIDARSTSEKTNWIDMNITSLKYERDASTNYTEIAGNFGDSIYSTNPNRRRGEIGFRTHAPQDDDDLSFLETSAKMGNQYYLRCLKEGYPIHVTSVDTDIKDSVYGPQKIIKFNFIEGS